MPQTFPHTLNALRAAAEPTRLRLLELLTHGELTVGEICSVLEQSQPRISRHLKLLCDAGLLARFREEHWVYYRVPLTGHGREVVAQLCSLIERNDPVLQADHRRMAHALAERARQVQSASANAVASIDKPLARLDAVLLEELTKAPVGQLLDIATGSGHVLRTLASHASHAVGVDISTEALRFARTQTYGAGLGHCIFRRGDMYALPFEDATFDTVTFDRVLATSSQPERALQEAARTLRSNGRVCVVENFDSLTHAPNTNPLQTLRAWFAQAGLHCERLRPVDIGSAHLIVALACARAEPLTRAA